MVMNWPRPQIWTVWLKRVENLDPEMVSGSRSALPPAAEYYGKKAYSEVPRRTHEPYLFEGEEDYTHSAFVAAETCNFIKEHKDERFFAIAGFYRRKY